MASHIVCVHSHWYDCGDRRVPIGSPRCIESGILDHDGFPLCHIIHAVEPGRSNVHESDTPFPPRTETTRIFESLPSYHKTAGEFLALC